MMPLEARLPSGGQASGIWGIAMKARGRLVAFAVLLALALTASPVRAELPVSEMRDAIDKGVDYLTGEQEDDGCWPFRITWVRSGYNVGMTSLVTLALRHTRLPRAAGPVQKGTAYVTQHPPEQATYTAGLVEMLLFEDGASNHIKLINAYAWMTVMSQWRDPGAQQGSWGYDLVKPPPDMTGAQEKLPAPAAPNGRIDHSNMQYAVLALAYAERAGYQVPTKVWERVKAHYEASQNEDGGWCYYAGGRVEGSLLSMTAASTVSLYLADEALATKKHNQCKMVPENPAVERGMKWIGSRRGQGPPYAWYAVERLGILTGRSEFGGRDWMEVGARALLKEDWKRERGGEVAGTAFAVLFLARALEPVIVNKLKREGDWNDDAYEVKHLTEYISEKFQNPKQWRIVTLDSSVDYLLRVPILFISGHQALAFTDAEKAKLKEYVNRGGTILAMACCSSKPFDESLRKLAAELWPDAKMLPLPRTHEIYKTPRPLAGQPALEGLALAGGQGRLGLIYSANDLCCRWHQGGTRATPVFDLGANIYFYVATTGVKLGGVSEGYRVDTTGPAKPPETPKPEPAKPAPPQPETPKPGPPQPETPDPPPVNAEPDKVEPEKK
jgi:hypothetical protein